MIRATSINRWIHREMFSEIHGLIHGMIGVVSSSSIFQKAPGHGTHDKLKYVPNRRAARMAYRKTILDTRIKGKTFKAIILNNKISK